MNNDIDLVIGGAGCVGAAVAEALRDRGRRVRVLDLWPADVDGVEVRVGDMGDRGALSAALSGAGAVYQCAALVSLHPASRKRLFETNVEKNRVVLDESRKAGASAFVYASTQVLCCRPGEPLDGVDESLPYSTRPVSAFAESRIESERDVLAADAPGAGFRTVSVRVPTTYGPRDRFHMPAHMWFADRGIGVRVGRARHTAQVYSENVAHALVLAAGALREGRCGGRAYYISDDPEPPAYWDSMSELLVACGRKPPRVRVPTAAFAPMVAGVEALWARLGDRVKLEPWVSYEALAVGALDCWFRTDAIRRDLGYEPPVPRAEAVRRTAAWFVSHPSPRPWP